MRVRILVIASVLAGCPSPSKTSSPTPTPTEPPTTEPGTPPPGNGSGIPQSGKPDGAPCLASNECGSGTCEGEGCTDDKPGRCAPQTRACTKDLRQYCGCDGKSFGASGSCPNRRFTSRSECAPAPGVPKPDGAACLAATDCASGVCEGEGCTDDKPGKCAPRARACTRDLRQYCGCDGKTFQTSGSCPARRYSLKKACGA